MRKQIRDHAVLTGILRIPGFLPELPGVAEERDEPLVVHGEDRVVRVLRSRDERRARLHQRIPDRLDPGRYLVPRIGQPDPHLAARLVQEAAVAPDDGDRQSVSPGRHGRELREL